MSAIPQQQQYLIESFKEVGESIFKKFPNVKVFRLIIWKDGETTQQDIDLLDGFWEDEQGNGYFSIVDVFSEAGSLVGQKLCIDDVEIQNSLSDEESDALKEALFEELREVAQLMQFLWGLNHQAIFAIDDTGTCHFQHMKYSPDPL